MIPVPSGVRVWLAVGRTDMRKGMNGLALQVQQVLGRDPHAGDLYVFRGARGDLIKIVWHDGIGMSGVSELPSFVAVEIAKDVPPLPAPLLEDKLGRIDSAPRRLRRKKAGVIEIELESGRRIRVDRDVDAAALERVLDVLALR